jgi:hypothetical protein
MTRLRRYKEDEQIALERWSENCRMAAEPADTGGGGA